MASISPVSDAAKEREGKGKDFFRDLQSFSKKSAVGVLRAWSADSF